MQYLKKFTLSLLCLLLVLPVATRAGFASITPAVESGEVAAYVRLYGYACSRVRSHTTTKDSVHIECSGSLGRYSADRKGPGGSLRVFNERGEDISGLSRVKLRELFPFQIERRAYISGLDERRDREMIIRAVTAVREKDKICDTLSFISFSLIGEGYHLSCNNGYYNYEFIPGFKGIKIKEI